MALNGSIIDEPEFDIDTAAEQLLKQWQKKPEAPKQAAPAAETHEEVEEEEEHEEEDHHEEGGEEGEEEQKPRQVADDEHEVVVSVDGQEHRVPVKDLKRLFGQEAALTQKSQAVAEAHTQATAQAERHVAALQTMIQRAEERLKPYESVDWALAAAKLSSEDYQQLKAAHETLSSDVKFYREELDGTIGSYRQKAVEQAKQASDACLKALVDPESKAHIEGFNEQVYNDIRHYAVDVGVPQQLIDNTYDPVAIKLIHKAMLYDKAQKTAMKKLTTAPKNVNKTPTNDGNASQGSARSAMQKLAETGDTDDAAAVLMARWGAA
jgi:hypothetical protein